MFGLGSGGTFAFVITSSNRIKVFGVQPIHGRMFLIPDLGMFQLNEKYRYTYKKSEVYHFDQSNCNPINLMAIMEVKNFLARDKRNSLNLQDLIHYVQKFRVVEERERSFEKVYETLHEKEGLSETQILEMYERGELDGAIERITNINMRAGIPKITANGSGLSDMALEWLNDYYREDVVARNYLFGRIWGEEKFKVRHSLGAPALVKEQFLGKRNVGIVVINNQSLDIDSDIKTEIDENTGFTNIMTKKYGTFRVEETKTRYRIGKSNVYYMAVKTAMPKNNQIIIEEAKVTN